MTSMPSMPSDPDPGATGPGASGSAPGSGSAGSPSSGTQWSKADRDLALNRLQKKRGYMAGLAAYVLVNLGLVAIWAAGGFGYFWPGWVIGGWGIGMALAGWDLYFRKPITQEDIDRELRGQQHPVT